MRRFVTTPPPTPLPMLEWLAAHYPAAQRHTLRRMPQEGKPPRVGLIHRLDRDASGLLFFSKNHEAYRSLKRQFFEHSVERVYTALVEGVPTPRAGKIRSRLVERADGTVYSTEVP